MCIFRARTSAGKGNRFAGNIEHKFQVMSRETSAMVLRRSETGRCSAVSLDNNVMHMEERAMSSEMSVSEMHKRGEDLVGTGRRNSISCVKL